MPGVGGVTIVMSTIVMNVIVMQRSCFLLRGEHGRVIVVASRLHRLRHRFVAGRGPRRLRAAQQHRGRGEALEGHASQQEPQQQCTEQRFHGAPW